MSWGLGWVCWESYAQLWWFLRRGRSGGGGDDFEKNRHDIAIWLIGWVL
jgi:hypothetical protein